MRDFCFELFDLESKQIEDRIFLTLNPQIYNKSISSLNQPIKILNNIKSYFLEIYGKNFITINISGVFGFNSKKTNSIVDGQVYETADQNKMFELLNKVFDKYLRQLELGKKYVLFFTNYLDEESYVIHLLNFNITRSADEPVLKKYNITFICLERYGDFALREKLEEIGAVSDIEVIEKNHILNLKNKLSEYNKTKANKVSAKNTIKMKKYEGDFKRVNLKRSLDYISEECDNMTLLSAGLLASDISTDKDILNDKEKLKDSDFSLKWMYKGLLNEKDVWRNVSGNDLFKVAKLNNLKGIFDGNKMRELNKNETVLDFINRKIRKVYKKYAGYFKDARDFVYGKKNKIVDFIKKKSKPAVDLINTLQEIRVFYETANTTLKNDVYYFKLYFKSAYEIGKIILKNPLILLSDKVGSLPLKEYGIDIKYKPEDFDFSDIITNYHNNVNVLEQFLGLNNYTSPYEYNEVNTININTPQNDVINITTTNDTDLYLIDVNNETYFDNTENDLIMIAGVDNLYQAITNRILTEVNTLIANRNYGTLLKDLITILNGKNVLFEIKKELERCLKSDFRIKDVRVKEIIKDGTRIYVNIDLITINKKYLNYENVLGVA